MHVGVCAVLDQPARPAHAARSGGRLRRAQEAGGQVEREGRLADAGFGTMAEAMSTLAHTTGQPDGPPTLPPIALADEVTGLRSASPCWPRCAAAT